VVGAATNVIAATPTGRCQLAPTRRAALRSVAMDDTTALDRMRTLEGRFLGLSGVADLAAIHAGVERLRAQLAETRTRERDEVFTTSIPDPCARAVFLALCRRYGLKPHRHARQRRATVVVAAPPSFYEGVLWPEFQALSDVLYDSFLSLTTRALHEVLAVRSEEGVTVERDEGP
jgi:hypothetical protein